ncbi:MAG TPA: hypothetical protein VLH61_07915 [Bacteroidales bacterium]|nr:hypothetical protein [Bacteroidales bacterium]
MLVFYRLGLPRNPSRPGRIHRVKWALRSRTRGLLLQNHPHAPSLENLRIFHEAGYLSRF